MLVSQSAFEDVLAQHGNVSLPQISQGATSQNHIRDLLINKSRSDASFPRFIEGDFLSGSYARGTKIFPLDDIDIMMVLDGTGLFAIRDGSYWNATVRGSTLANNPVLRELDWQGLLSSRRVMEILQNALKQSYPNSKVAKDGQAINVWLDSHGLGMDVIPCFHVIPADGSRDVYYIPAGSQTDGWMMTNPKIDENISDQLHSHHNEKLKPVIKLIKLWNRVFNNNRLRSYHLESVAWYVFARAPNKITHYGTALLYFFQNAGSHIAVSCPDPTNIGGPIDTYLNPQDRILSLQKIDQTKTILTNSYLLGLANEPRQMSGWRQIFGDGFGRNN